MHFLPLAVYFNHQNSFTLLNASNITCLVLPEETWSPLPSVNVLLPSLLSSESNKPPNLFFDTGVHHRTLVYIVSVTVLEGTEADIFSKQTFPWMLLKLVYNMYLLLWLHPCVALVQCC